MWALLVTWDCIVLVFTESDHDHDCLDQAAPASGSAVRHLKFSYFMPRGSSRRSKLESSRMELQVSRGSILCNQAIASLQIQDQKTVHW